MAQNAVVSDSVAGFRRMSQTPLNSRLPVQIALCVASRDPIDPSEKRRERT